MAREGLLAGVKVVEISQLVAGSMPGAFLADFGADVVHVEDPVAGDPVRGLGPAKDGVKVWWKVAARNKRSVSIDLRRPEGQALARRLATWADVVVTNFRASTLERWQLDFATLQALSPKLIMLQVSALGSTGPTRDVPGFGKIGEARSGVAYVSGFEGAPPVFSGFLLSDAATALLGALAIEMALYRRTHDPAFQGEWIDDTLTEPLFRLVDWQVIVHDQLGVVPERVGNDTWMTRPAMARTCVTADRTWLLVAASSVDEREALADLLATETHADRTDGTALDTWVGARTAATALAELAAAGVTCSKVFTIADIFADETYAEREAIITVADDELGPVRMHAVVPRLREYPGWVWRTGPSLGHDNPVVLQEYLSMSDDDVAALVRHGTIGATPHDQRPEMYD